MNSAKSSRLVLGAWILGILAGPPICNAQSSDEVQWIDQKKSGALWETVRSAFHDELQPDDPAKTAPVLAYAYKYVYRVAKYKDSALVIVGYRETEHSKYPGYYSAFNYDLRSHKKNED